MLAGGRHHRRSGSAAFAGDSMLTGSVSSIFRKAGDSDRHGYRAVGRSAFPPRTRVSWFEPRRPGIGDIWQLELRLRRPRGTSNPGVFDYESWLFREKIQASGYVVSGKRNRLLQAQGRRLRPFRAISSRCARRNRVHRNGCGTGGDRRGCASWYHASNGTVLRRRVPVT